MVRVIVIIYLVGNFIRVVILFCLGNVCIYFFFIEVRFFVVDVFWNEIELVFFKNGWR